MKMTNILFMILCAVYPSQWDTGIDMLQFQNNQEMVMGECLLRLGMQGKAYCDHTHKSGLTVAIGQANVCFELVEMG